MKSIAVNNPRSSYFIGGAEMVSIEHAKHLAILGFDVTFYTINPKSINAQYSEQYADFKNKFSSRIRFFELDQDTRALHVYKIQPGEDRNRWNLESLFYSRQLSAYLINNRKQYDVLISYFNLDAISVHRDNVACNTIYLCGIPRDESIFRFGFLAMYDRVIAITNETREYWQKYTENIIDVIPTGVDSVRFMPNNHVSEKVKIIFLGRLIERKGAHILLSSISKLPVKFLNMIEVVIAGDGPQAQILSRQIDTLGLNKYIQLVGAVSNPEKYMSDADICVQPSTGGEGLQGVILEAMASGTVVIASNSQTNTVLLSDGRGITLDSIDAQSLANQLVAVLDNPKSRQSIGERARHYVVDNNDWYKIVEKIIGGD